MGVGGLHELWLGFALLASRPQPLCQLSLGPPEIHGPLLILSAVCGFVLERTGSFSLIFQATAAMYLLGTAVWTVGCRTTPQFD